MEAPLDLEVTLARPAGAAGEEPRDSVFARVRLRLHATRTVRPALDLCFVLDASASMHTFELEPSQRAEWQAKAEQRGEVSRQQADGRTGLVWRGQTLRELQQQVSTPMLSTLRGVWKCVETLAPTDSITVVGFADRADLIYQDSGVPSVEVRKQAARTALTRLGSGVDESGLGRGTRLLDALSRGLERVSGAALGAPLPPATAMPPGLRRMVLVSDGIIEDREECRAVLDQAVDRGVVISVIGVGEEFDEEFLMQIADLSRGNYYYAANAKDAEAALVSELDIVTRALGRNAVLKVFPDNGTVLRDVYPVAPQMSEFQCVWVENGGWRFRIGDLSAIQPMEFLVELMPAAQPAGQTRIARVRVEGTAPDSPVLFAAEEPVPFFYADDPVLLQARDDEVEDAVRRLEIYKVERRAAEAARSGDLDLTTRHLRTATRMLKKIGQDGLAAEMEAAADNMEAGTRNLGQEKRLKLGTRKLSSH